MSKFSDYAENAIINHVFCNIAYTSPAKLWLGLYTVTPSDAGGGTEVNTNAYARMNFALSNASGGATSNPSDITFATSNGDWGTIVAVGIHDANVNGNLIMWGALTANKTVNNGDTFKVNAGDLDITVD